MAKQDYDDEEDGEVENPRARKGSNSGADKMLGGNTTAAQLLSVIERIERLDEEKAGIAADIKDVFAEAKGNGFDVKTIRLILKERKIDKDDRDEQEALLDLYRHALNMA